MATLGLYLADMAAWPSGPTPNGRSRTRDWLDANDGFRRRVLDQLRASGPMASRDIPDTCEVPWVSTGWTNDRNVNLAERVHPAGVAVSPFDHLVHDRARATALFDFEYVLEMYKPKAKRRWGCFAADRKAKVLLVHAVHEDVPFTAAMTEDVVRT